MEAIRVLGEPAARSEGRRRAILDAALELFTVKGVRATSVEDIRLGSGASTGSIYHHFGSKEELAGALIVESLGDYQEGAIAIVKEAADTETCVKELARYHLRWIAAHPSRARLLLAERDPGVILATDIDLKRLNQRFFEEMESWFCARMESGEVKPTPSDIVYSIIVGPGQEYARAWLAGRTQTPIEEAIELTADRVWDALRGGSR